MSTPNTKKRRASSPGPSAAVVDVVAPGTTRSNARRKNTTLKSILAARSPLLPDVIVPPPGEVLPTELEQVQQAIDMTAEKSWSLKRCCEFIGLPYARAYVLINAHPELIKRWNAARVTYLQNKVEEMEDIARDTTLDVQRARLLCDNIKWEAQRVARHIYGDHIVVSGDADAPLVTKLVVSSADLVNKIRGAKSDEPD